MGSPRIAGAGVWLPTGSAILFEELDHTSQSRGSGAGKVASCLIGSLLNYLKKNVPCCISGFIASQEGTGGKATRKKDKTTKTKTKHRKKIASTTYPCCTTDFRWCTLVMMCEFHGACEGGKPGQ